MFTVYDGPNAFSPVIFSDCGLKEGDDLWRGYSTTNELFMTFSADSSVSRGGYRVVWECSESTSESFSYHFSVGGSDEGDCSEVDPCQGFGRALEKAKGDFHLNVVLYLQWSGMAYGPQVCDNDLSFSQSVTINGDGSVIDCGNKMFVSSKSKQSVFEIHGIALINSEGGVDPPVDGNGDGNSVVSVISLLNPGAVTLKNVNFDVWRGLSVVIEEAEKVVMEGCVCVWC